ncbi:hypothetical protein NC651_025229 [Populus alba x Populus x berolinensis]|nr:hypothetical protein NC651_025229 [Populus alba x Populus x berolinensis]
MYFIFQWWKNRVLIIFSNTAIPEGKLGAVFLNDFIVNLNNNKDLDCSHDWHLCLELSHRAACSWHGLASNLSEWFSLQCTQATSSF